MDSLVFTMQMQEIVLTLSAAKASKKDGKGNVYVKMFCSYLIVGELGVLSSYNNQKIIQTDRY